MLSLLRPCQHAASHSVRLQGLRCFAGCSVQISPSSRPLLPCDFVLALDASRPGTATLLLLLQLHSYWRGEGQGLAAQQRLPPIPCLLAGSVLQGKLRSSVGLTQQRLCPAEVLVHAWILSERAAM